MDQRTIDDGKTIAIISYITIFGLIIAYFMNRSKQNAFAKYHMEQSVRIVILSATNSLLGWTLPSSLSFITTIIGLCVIVLIILGIVNAANRKTEPLPVIGTLGN